MQHVVMEDDFDFEDELTVLLLTGELRKGAPEPPALPFPLVRRKLDDDRALRLTAQRHLS